jgi:hypothetical protein
MRDDLEKKGIDHADNVERQPLMIPFGNMNKRVFNPGGEHLGDIEDVIVDLTNIRIAFGVLSFGGIFGLGEKRYAIPWEMLQYDEKRERFILDIEKEKLETAESFDRDRYPYSGYGPWAPGIYGFWGRPPYW